VTKRGGGESEALDRLEADDVALEKILDEARCAAARADGLRLRASARIEAAVDRALRAVCGEDP
jgi:hypothetical protein